MLACLTAVLVALLLGPPDPATQGTAPPPTPQELKTYGAFRAWITSQPADVQRAEDDVVFQRYGAELRRQGRTDAEIASTINLIKKLGDRAEIERWNQILTSPT